MGNCTEHEDAVQYHKASHSTRTIRKIVLSIPYAEEEQRVEQAHVCNRVRAAIHEGNVQQRIGQHAQLSV